MIRTRPANAVHRGSEARFPGLTDAPFVRIDLAGTVVVFRSGNSSSVAAVRRRFASFLVQGGEAEIEVIHARADNDDTEGFATEVDVTNRRIMLHGELVIAQLEGALRTLLPVVASPDLIVHAALLAHGGRGYLCCGKPGAGKSTLAGLFPEAALSDELARLHLSSASVEGRSLPFWLGHNRGVTIEKIFFLQHGIANYSTRLTPAQTLRELRRHIYWPLDDHGAAIGVFEGLAEVAGRIPGYQLEFLPDRSVWVALSEAA